MPYFIIFVVRDSYMNVVIFLVDCINCYNVTKLYYALLEIQGYIFTPSMYLSAAIDAICHTRCFPSAGVWYACNFGPLISDCFLHYRPLTCHNLLFYYD
jgi:hypothetical protein